MSTHHRRLAALEKQAVVSSSWDERDEAFFGWLSSPSLIVVAGAFANDLAHRRYGDGWFSLGPDQRAARIRLERATLAALFQTEQFHHGALRAWLTAPDEEGWQPLPWGQGTNYDAFVVQLARERAMLAVHRAWDGEYGREWRRRHPEWRQGMSPDEYDFWEAGLGKAWMI